jgi:hypothetical protein
VWLIYTKRTLNSGVMMERATIQDLVSKRQYSELERRAEEYIASDEWAGFMKQIKRAGLSGKARDAVVTLLELAAVGGTDSNVFDEFATLEGTSFQHIKVEALERAIEILREQIENRHTYFLDVEAMAETPYAILVKDVIEARKRELSQLEGTVSRLDVLGTFYGLMILITDGSRPHDNSGSSNLGYGYRRWKRRTWLDENISQSAADAVKRLTGEFTEEIDMDKRYRTLGSSSIFKNRCTPRTAEILANTVRLSLYKVPGNRSAAAVALGRTRDSRVLPFLHHRFGVEESRQVRMRIAEALGKVGDISSIEILKGHLVTPLRYLSKDYEAAINALGAIYSPECKKTLLDILANGGNTVKAAAIQALGRQEPTNLVRLLTEYLKHKSKPVVRAAVLSLTELGTEGKDIVRAQASTVLERIGHDRSSSNAIVSILQIPGVSQMYCVHEFFAKRIYRLRKEAERWKQRVNATSYAYWYRRRERRAMIRLNEAVSMANRYLQPPFQPELVNSVEAALRLDSQTSYQLSSLGDSELVKVLRKRQSVAPVEKDGKASFEQTYFV